jgi:uncharacterized protein YcfJ
MKAGSADVVAIGLAVALVVGGGLGFLIGRGKGRPALGFVLGLLLGLIGWIITALLPRPATVTRAQRPSRGWYPDPTGVHEFRYFDGYRWMADVANRGRMSTSPVDQDATAAVR